ncbi:MAG: hypothetical protein C4541_08700 [Candidatus Auribacter fodinae]|jgi:hypothetical protein|uniref:Uncharacterized protein n=1 Tax=Candidatus Auribacter fodinae TaxID=2093366 RepID=A0A3A4R5K1_9BACT|nr:MAG: hypothetical protein C4541_08700 [Candidatus Auribacter fodinae]
MIEKNERSTNRNNGQAPPMNTVKTPLNQRQDQELSSSQEIHLSWRDVPAGIIELLDSFPYEDNFKITIHNLKEGNTLLDRLKKHSVKYQECYLSKSLYYFINRDYDISVKALKRSMMYYRVSRFTKQTQDAAHRSVRTYFYCLVLQGVIHYIRGCYRKARRSLLKSGSLEHHQAVLEFISLIDHIRSRKQ